MAEIKKEKTYIFRHLKQIKCLPNMLPEEELKQKLIEAVLAKGYVPINVKFQKIKYESLIKTIEYDAAFCYTAYAGKKSARELFKTLSTDQINGNRGDTIYYPKNSK